MTPPPPSNRPKRSTNSLLVPAASVGRKFAVMQSHSFSESDHSDLEFNAAESLLSISLAHSSHPTSDDYSDYDSNYQAQSWTHAWTPSSSENPDEQMTPRAESRSRRQPKSPSWSNSENEHEDDDDEEDEDDEYIPGLENLTSTQKNARRQFVNTGNGNNKRKRSNSATLAAARPLIGSIGPGPDMQNKTEYGVGSSAKLQKTYVEAVPSSAHLSVAMSSVASTPANSPSDPKQMPQLENMEAMLEAASSAIRLQVPESVQTEIEIQTVSIQTDVKLPPRDAITQTEEEEEAAKLAVIASEKEKESVATTSNTNTTTATTFPSSGEPASAVETVVAVKPEPTEVMVAPAPPPPRENDEIYLRIHTSTTELQGDKSSSSPRRLSIIALDSGYRAAAVSTGSA